MKSFTTVLLVSTLVGTSLANPVAAPSSSGSVCSSGIYKYLSPLKSWAPAGSYCSSRYPLPVSTSTVTVSTVTTTIWATATASTTTTGTATVTAMATTQTLITSPLSVTVTATASICSLSTTPNAVKRDLEERNTSSSRSRRPASTTICESSARWSQRSSLWSSVQTREASIISTACSCIETPSTKIVATTPTAIASSTTTTTKTIGASTTTTTTSTVTVKLTTFSTSTVTATATVQVAPAAQPTDCTNGSVNQGFTELCGTDCNNGNTGILYTSSDSLAACISKCQTAANDEALTLTNVAFDYCDGSCNCFETDGSSPALSANPAMACATMAVAW